MTAFFRTAALAVIAVAIGVSALAVQAWAQDVLATEGPWTAMSAGTGKDRVCYVASAPQKELGDYTQRGDTFVLVSHRPGENVRDVVEVRAGYTYKPDSEVAVNIDGKKYSLFTDADSAWARDDLDRRLAAAMKAGREMIITGTSSRSTVTTDTYSLSGFTAAYNAAAKACGL